MFSLLLSCLRTKELRTQQCSPVGALPLRRRRKAFSRAIECLRTELPAHGGKTRSSEVVKAVRSAGCSAEARSAYYAGSRKRTSTAVTLGAVTVYTALKRTDIRREARGIRRARQRRTADDVS